MMEMYANRDRLPYFKLNQNIHSAILRLSKNEALAYVTAFCRPDCGGSATSATRVRRNGPAPLPTMRK